MSDLPSMTSDVTDADLIGQVRSGDLDAFGVLFGRHRDAAHRLARQLVAASDVDDLVADAFSKVMTALRNGNGPDEFFRAYLLTSLRSVHVDKIRASSRYKTTGDESELDHAVEFVDPAEWKFEQTAAATAFASLPERWQMVLWHLDVERQKPADIAPLLGMTANSVSALAYRAREGLRTAYLQSHLAPSMNDACKKTTSLLGPYVRKALRSRDMATVDAHLDDCRHCTGLYLELVEINGGLAGLLAPFFLGAASVGYLGGTGSVTAATTLIAGVPARITAITSSGSGTVAAIGAATVTVVGGAVGVGVVANQDATPPAAAQAYSAPSLAPTRTTPPTTSASALVPTPTRVPSTDAPSASPSLLTGQLATPSAAAPPAGTPSTTPPAAPTASATTQPTTPSPTPTSRPTAGSEPISVPPPTPTPTTSPTPTPTRDVPGNDYSIASMTSTNIHGPLRRKIQIAFNLTDRVANHDDVRVEVTLSAVGPRNPDSLTLISSSWSCDPVELGVNPGRLVCTRTQTTDTVPDLTFSYFGSYGIASANVSVPGRADPTPANNSRSVDVTLHYWDYTD